MPGNLNIDNAISTNMSSLVDDITVPTRETDGVTGSKETTWFNDKWSQYLGYYKQIPELKIAIDMRAIWTVGKGFTADPYTSTLLDGVTGWGNDTFDTIINNLVVARRIGGDSYAEIIRDDQGFLLNIKPLDPGTIRHVVNDKGILIRYEQWSKKGDKVIHKFKTGDILHLVNKRVADEIHGTSDIEALEPIIKANNESFLDVQQLQHRHVKPRFAFKIDTDNSTKIAAFQAKMDAIVNKGENIVIPQGSVEFELIAVPSNATLNPLPWRQHLRDYFYQVVGIPQIILGSSGEFTESTAKIAYLAFEQSVKAEQRDIEAQLWNQLFMKVEFEFPASLQNELLDDRNKDGNNATQTVGQPADLQAGAGA